MPTYDYRCEKCNHVFEEFHGMTEEPEVKCPSCGERAKKMIGGGLGVIFKGSGFYVNDSKSASKASTSPGASSGEGKSKEAASADSGGSGTSETSSSGTAKTEKKEPAKTAAG